MPKGTQSEVSIAERDMTDGKPLLLTLYLQKEWSVGGFRPRGKLLRRAFCCLGAFDLPTSPTELTLWGSSLGPAPSTSGLLRQAAFGTSSLPSMGWFALERRQLAICLHVARG